MILKGPDVRARTLVVPHSLAGLSHGATSSGGGSPLAAARGAVLTAEADRKAIYDDARAEGLEEGRKAGYEEGAGLARAELIEQLDLAHGIAAQAIVDRAALIAAAEPEIVRLAMDVARKLVAREVE